MAAKNIFDAMLPSCIFMIMHKWGRGRWAAGPSRKSSVWDSELCMLDPPRCRWQVSAPCSTAKEEGLGVGGLCNLAKRVYTEIQAGETNGCKRKTLTHKKHHMFDFKRLKEYQ